MNGCYQVSCSESQEQKQQKRLPIWSGLVPRIQPSCPEGPGILSLVTRRCCLVKRVAYGIVGRVLSCFVRSLPTKCNGTWRRCVRSLVCIPRQISVLLIQFKIFMRGAAPCGLLGAHVLQRYLYPCLFWRTTYI